MRPFSPKYLKAGEPISVRPHNAAFTETARMSRLNVSGDLEMTRDGITAVLPRRQAARITAHGSGGAYAWQAVIAIGGGAWTDDPASSGTTMVNPAYENSANATVPIGSYVELKWFGTASEWRFDAVHC